MTNVSVIQKNHTDIQITERPLIIALAGQPNMGKSTLFNLLTGLNQHVGNWPGKTVEYREGKFQHNNRVYQLVDLPGTYSLTASSPEEIIAREFILQEKPDLVIVVVSAANLERSLYLAAELICLPSPVVIALNMMDVAKQEGIVTEANVLQAAIGVPVVPMTATKSTGVRDLLQVIEDTLAGNAIQDPVLPDIRDDHKLVLQEILYSIRGYVPNPYPEEWIAIKLLEGDKEITEKMKLALPPERYDSVNTILTSHDDAFLAIASGRYEWIGRMIRAAVTHPQLGQVSLTDRLDRWATHPFLGLVILAGILGLVFWVTFTIGAPLQDWLDTGIVAPLSEFAANILVGTPAWFNALIVDGVIGGVGAVITFLPIMAIFFASFGLLEDIGYMARAAFVMDNFMHMMGLHGKSFLPLFLGFGCNVPSIMGSRVIDSAPARLLTILVAPLVPCTARLAVLAFIAPAFFGTNATLVSWGLIIGALVILVFSGIVLNRLLFKNERSAFIMELPLYHIPNVRTIGLLVWQRSLSFIKKAGTIILALSVGVWILSVLPNGNLETSFLAQIGYFVEPVGRWMGMDWRLTIALLTSFLAKENSIATLGVLFGSSEEAGLAATLASIYSPATALAFLTVSLLFIPCAATVAVIKQETNSWGWTLVNILMMLVLSIAAGAGVFFFATAIGY